MLKNKTFIAVFIKCLLMPINAGTMLYKGRISYLLVLNQRWAVRGSRAFSAGPIKNKIVWKNVFIDYLGIIFICVMSTKLPMISLVEVELEYPT